MMAVLTALAAWLFLLLSACVLIAAGARDELIDESGEPIVSALKPLVFGILLLALQAGLWVTVGAMMRGGA